MDSWISGEHLNNSLALEVVNVEMVFVIREEDEMDLEELLVEIGGP